MHGSCTGFYLTVLYKESRLHQTDALLPSLRVSEAKQFQQKLDETTVLLRDLHEAQRERLSAKQPPNMICLLAPTAKELQLGTHSHNLNISYSNTHHLAVSGLFSAFAYLWLTLSSLCVCVCVAEKVTENLAQLTSQVTPRDVSSLYGIRKAMGISLPHEPAEGTYTHLTTGTNTRTI